MKPEEVRALRERLGMTQMEFAQKLGTTVSTISRWETGMREPRGLYAKALIGLLRKHRWAEAGRILAEQPDQTAGGE